jgi:hypothetical protein
LHRGSGRLAQALAALELIRTSRKEKLPKGFSYPVGAEVISAALVGVLQFNEAAISFSWKDTFWASEYNPRIRANGRVTVFEVNYWNAWRIFVHAVPSEHAQRAREQLPSLLSVLASQLRGTPAEPRHFRWEASYDLATSTLSVGS